MFFKHDSYILISAAINTTTSSEAVKTAWYFMWLVSDTSDSTRECYARWDPQLVKRLPHGYKWRSLDDQKTSVKFSLCAGLRTFGSELRRRRVSILYSDWRVLEHKTQGRFCKLFYRNLSSLLLCVRCTVTTEQYKSDIDASVHGTYDLINSKLTCIYFHII